MGYYSGWGSRREVIAECSKGWTQNSVPLESLTGRGITVADGETPESFRMDTVCVTKQYKGGIRVGNLWSVFEQRIVRKSTEEILHRSPYIRLDMLSYHRRGGDGDWGYKPLTEDMGPVEVSCPLKYIRMVPDPGGFATDWRKRVEEYHASRKRYKAKHGEKVALREGVKLDGEPLKWVIYQSHKKGGIALTPWNSPVIGVNKHIAGPYVEQTTDSGAMATATS